MYCVLIVYIYFEWAAKRCGIIFVWYICKLQRADADAGDKISNKIKKNEIILVFEPSIFVRGAVLMVTSVL